MKLTAQKMRKMAMRLRAEAAELERLADLEDGVARVVKKAVKVKAKKRTPVKVRKIAKRRPVAKTRKPAKKMVKKTVKRRELRGQQRSPI